MKAAEKDAKVWLRIANVFDEVASGKRLVREAHGICHQVFYLAESESQKNRMYRTAMSMRPKGVRQDMAYFFPLTREGAKQRANLCRRMARR
jgi:hypothetical protein